MRNPKKLPGWEDTIMIISYYHELREVSSKKARELVGKVLEQNKDNVSKSAKVLGISRNSVIRFLKSFGTCDPRE
jgi:transcriptional regulator with PAS, ATPase and Fis domain